MRRLPHHDHCVLIEKHTIRIYYYVGSLATVVLLWGFLSYVFASSLREEFENKIDQLSRGVLADKQRLTKNAVNQTIYYIEHERKRVRQELVGSGLSDQEVEKRATAVIKEYIRNIRFADDGYVWVNRIVNYEGGDKYAVREVHPNLPETEGSWLSTSTADINGALPYLAELEGIKKNGELYSEYYFKKLGSDKVTRKMSFAKLYKPYDCVIATGVYLDDVDTLVEAERAKMEASLQSQRGHALAVAAGIVIFCTLVIVFFERQIAKLIASYEQKIEGYTHSLEEASFTDSLTGLYNRVRLDEVFRYESSQFKRYEKAFSIILMDVDHFKSINDTYGHQVGDRVLVEVAGVLRDNTRETDTVGRWGGEEFLLICPETRMESAMQLAEKIRLIIEARDFQTVGRVTSSFGISTFHGGDDPEAMLERADRALYRAKASGRNRVESEADLPAQG